MTLSTVMVLLLAVVATVFGIRALAHDIQTKRRVGFALSHSLRISFLRMRDSRL